MNNTTETILSTAEREKLKRLLEQAPLAEMADELGDALRTVREDI